ncbi:TPA: hypothetical protein ACMDVU_003225 [Vibrio parahaemolyticus]|uniref:hypothetical protein n=1 Tax=Vibrio parahaemolyticus TaxID=670 RepID=UPI00215F6C26|nr:hypothetical protein [Vibrio parahaemolyticus]EIO4081394.1 hypothetical protein [Vibrio parahaemolyticus]ELA7285647.1 hypothetical protein [Vibrio parahaemolyticus]MCS0143232.1 hypothetical protein [Vibrio parahaemolyticus]
MSDSTKGASSTSSTFIEMLRQKAQEQQTQKNAPEKAPGHSKGLLQRLDDLEKEIRQQDKQHDPKTRSELTMKFVAFFFLILAGSYIFVLIYNEFAVTWMIRLKEKGLDESIKNITLLDFQAVISLIISGLGTSLGFIIGYYFKDKNPN